MRHRARARLLEGLLGSHSREPPCGAPDRAVDLTCPEAQTVETGGQKRPANERAAGASHDVLTPTTLLRETDRSRLLRRGHQSK
jgi:hypothetical protein